eukprot:TRINITY_DN8189_c0_g1_i1.p1 TRINITY_DN8189_c0_g1~~TRINITY_DN8189_c0_g1_i1.p1  ORF type:complete len:415 (-),score=26.56 TRINITY_DN8189_c0_g1_i1:121-1365(-)
MKMHSPCACNYHACHLGLVIMICCQLHAVALKEHVLRAPETNVAQVPRPPSCRVKFIGGGPRVLMNVPPIESTPTTWEGAKSWPVDPNSENCYEHGNSLVDNAQCCCAFWAIPPTKRAAALSAQDRGECSRTYANLTSGPRTHEASKSSCRFALALSGFIGLKTFERLPEVFTRLERHAIGSRTDVCVVVYATALNSELGHKVKNILDSKAYVADYSLEIGDLGTNERVAGAIQDCAGNMFSELRQEIMNRKLEPLYGPTPPSSDTASMYRKIWLAHKMARSLNSNLQLIARGRIDGMHSMDISWERYLHETADGKILVAEARPGLYLSRKNGLRDNQRCAIDDRFALGPPALMDHYASVYPDFQELASSLLLTRADGKVHFNERIMAAHLHFREVPFEMIGEDVFQGVIVGRR